MVDPVITEETDKDKCRSIIKLVARSLFAGGYKFTTYYHAIRFLNEALYKTPESMRISSSNKPWRLLEIGKKTMNWFMRRTSKKKPPPSNLRNKKLAWSAFTVISTEFIFLLFEELIERYNFYYLGRYTLPLLQLCSRAFQMGAVGYCIGHQHTGLVIGLSTALGFFVLDIVSKVLTRENNADIEKRNYEVCGGFLALALVLTRVLKSLKIEGNMLKSLRIEDNIRADAAGMLAVTMAVKCWQIECEKSKGVFNLRSLFTAAEVGALGILLGDAQSYPFNATLFTGAVIMVMWVVQTFFTI